LKGQIRMFVFQFCYVATVAHIHKRKEPNLAIGKRGEKTSSGIPLCFGKPSNDEVDICESSMNRSVSHRCKILHNFFGWILCLFGKFPLVQKCFMSFGYGPGKRIQGDANCKELFTYASLILLRHAQTGTYLSTILNLATSYS
jgi:hypothetical protein